MICFFGNKNSVVYAVQTQIPLSELDQEKISWLFDGQPYISKSYLEGDFVGPRVSMVTPWSTNAVEITQNMGIKGIIRIEKFIPSNVDFDPMLFQKFHEIGQQLFTIDIQPDPVHEIEDINVYNLEQGLSLNAAEVEYLEQLSINLKRKLTDSEVFGFSQVNSEHCRHKIFNGQFIIDEKPMDASLFELIKKTSQNHGENLISAYKDNVAFIKGPSIEQFAPKKGEEASFYTKKIIPSAISLKAETHNFPTTVEPFNGAATGSGGEIRDRLAGGKGSLPLAGTAVYMTAYPRLDNHRRWIQAEERKWLYQAPEDILIKASNGASDFGNKFGQPLISGSLLTFEHQENNAFFGFDKVIMLAGGIGYTNLTQSQKDKPKKGDVIVVMGGDNYRIGMGGAAVSSADTGAFDSGIELNAVQRSNPEMQKRVANTIRAFVESDKNTIVSIHDHGAGGHLNCLSELVEETGGHINMDKLPVGDTTLSAKEIIGNESQERMGLVIAAKSLKHLQKIAKRERAPLFVVGTISGDYRFEITSEKTNQKPIDLSLADFFGKTPQTIMRDQTIKKEYKDVDYDPTLIYEYVEHLLQLEAVACKDWLTNKVDRCVGGKVAQQQTVGSLQLPLANCGVMALDYTGQNGIATSIGHAPLSALIDPEAGSRLAIAEALTNIIWTPIEKGISSISLSANWMWPCNNLGEDARLYKAVQACSKFAIELGVNIPTGKDSLSMKQKYPDKNVIAPGTVIISATAHCSNVLRVIKPVARQTDDALYYINMSSSTHLLGGSSFAQLQGVIGKKSPDIIDSQYFKKTFTVVQDAIKSGGVVSGHDIGSGGLITSLLEMCFPEINTGLNLDFSEYKNVNIVELLFAENPSLIIQLTKKTAQTIKQKGVELIKIGHVTSDNAVRIRFHEKSFHFDIFDYRKHWFRTSYLLDRIQSGEAKAQERFKSFDQTPLKFKFPKHFTGKKPTPGQRIKAAIIREKGSNSEREMAYVMDLAGFDVKDIHMTDLMSGRENLEDVQFIVAVGGFSNSDVLGSAKGWAGSFRYNENAQIALTNFFERDDTLSLGVCNGCQLFIELGLLHPDHEEKPKMLHNDSGKFECVFTSVSIQQNNSVMLNNMEGSVLGIWSAHAEGKFHLPLHEERYHITAKYTHKSYPSNPNGSAYNTAMLNSDNGRHLVMMPHLERANFPWNWAMYPDRNDEVTPWIQAFVNAHNWLHI